MLLKSFTLPRLDVNQKQHYLRLQLLKSITRKPTRRCHASISFNAISLENIAQIAHNKVLVSAAVSAAIGQLSKPFTSSWLYGKDFNLSSSVQAGGFPSTHSSAVIATATSLALDRGFADPIFGMAMVYASLVMYDAQGVRREVGTHAKTLNQLLPKKAVDDIIDSVNSLKTPLSSSLDDVESALSSKLNQKSLVKASAGTVLASNEEEVATIAELKESIGHTEVEVMAGGLLGFLVSLAVFSIV